MLREQRHSYRKDGREHVMPPSGFRALVALDSPYLERDGRRYRLNSGMLVSAEIHLGTRTVMEYLLSTVSQTLHEAGREK
jgi:HlyD family secretion protein